MKLDQLSVAQRFVRDLTQLRQRAGRPSYSTLERLSRHRLKRATMSDVLNGNRVNLPDWMFVAAFVTACHAAAEESGLDPNDLGTVADWKRHWDSASSGVIDARFPGHTGQSFTRHDSTPAVAPVVAHTRTATRWREPPPSSVWGPAPSRLPDFVGREAWLEAIKHALTKEGRARVVAIQGLIGVGKTQLALEYAHRFSHEYDLVWWIPCDDVESARSAMADLSTRLGLDEPSPAPDESDYGELFDLLRRDQRYVHWLLVFDNVKEPDEIRSLIPPISGHVLVTTRNSRWEAAADMLELDVFDRSESVEFLRRRARKLNAVSAHRLAEGVGDLPLLLEHAVESHVTTGAYLERLYHDPLELLDDQPADYHATIAGEWRTVIDRLGAEATDALDLLQCLAFFGEDPVPRESLERGSYIADVSVHQLLRDRIRRLRAITRLRREGLLKVSAGTGSFELHQVTRCIVRATVAASGAAGEERARHDVHLLLAAADPLAPDDPATWRTYEELRAHAAESGITACSHDIVRKLVVNLVHFLNATGDPRAALGLADEALAHWNDDEVKDGDSRVVISMAKADALYACGERAAAFELRQEALSSMRSDANRWRAEIVQLEGASGARLRIMGRFAEALAADRQSVRTHVAEFSREDPRTFAAVDSLITDLVLAGLADEATRTAGDAYRDCLAFYRDALHPAVLAVRNILGRCRWLSGQYSEAVSGMADVHLGYAELTSRGILDEDHPKRLRHEIDYAIARRDAGLHLHRLVDDMQDVRRRCWRMFGPDHPQTLAATVVLGSTLRRAGGGSGEAARLLRDAERRYHSALPDHPYGPACTGLLASVRYMASVRYTAARGSMQRAAARSVPVLREVVGRLSDAVGETHPLSLTALAALANALARAGELDAALTRGLEALDGTRARFGADHPHALACEANTSTIRSELWSKPVPEDLHARYATALGPDHPDVALFAQGRLVDIEFTPLPL